jgi:hypothetical protein
MLYERPAVQAPDAPQVGDWWYDAALAYKSRRNWAQAYRLDIQTAIHAPRRRARPGVRTSAGQILKKTSIAAVGAGAVLRGCGWSEAPPLAPAPKACARQIFQ